MSNSTDAQDLRDEIISWVIPEMHQTQDRICRNRMMTKGIDQRQGSRIGTHDVLGGWKQTTLDELPQRNLSRRKFQSKVRCRQPEPNLKACPWKPHDCSYLLLLSIRLEFLCLRGLSPTCCSIPSHPNAPGNGWQSACPGCF